LSRSGFPLTSEIAFAGVLSPQRVASIARQTRRRTAPKRNKSTVVQASNSTLIAIFAGLSTPIEHRTIISGANFKCHRGGNLSGDRDATPAIS
jgi:hypothetical protein